MEHRCQPALFQGYRDAIPCRLVLDREDEALGATTAERGAVEQLGHFTRWIDDVRVEGLEACQQDVASAGFGEHVMILAGRWRRVNGTDAGVDLMRGAGEVRN